LIKPFCFSRDQPIFGWNFRQGLKITIRREGLEFHLAGQCGYHLIDLGKNPAPAPQHLVDLAVKARCLEIDRPNADMP
jgi:hypothetical protein